MLALQILAGVGLITVVFLAGVLCYIGLQLVTGRNE